VREKHEWQVRVLGVLQAHQQMDVVDQLRPAGRAEFPEFLVGRCPVSPCPRWS
jgi:hypothetical protein